jgi:hypothetical protein
MDDQPTRLWLVRRGDREVACLVRLVPYGIEVDIASNGIVLLTRSFDTDSDALAWADTKRRAKEAQGWRPVELAPSDLDLPAS